MSKITRTQNLGVSWWRATSCVTIGPESCLGGVLHNRLVPKLASLPQGGHKKIRKKMCKTYARHCTVVASFGLRNRDIHDFSACVMSDADVVWTVCSLDLSNSVKGMLFCHSYDPKISKPFGQFGETNHNLDCHFDIFVLISRPLVQHHFVAITQFV